MGRGALLGLQSLLLTRANPSGNTCIILPFEIIADKNNKELLFKCLWVHYSVVV